MKQPVSHPVEDYRDGLLKWISINVDAPRALSNCLAQRITARNEIESTIDLG